MTHIPYPVDNIDDAVDLLIEDGNKFGEVLRGSTETTITVEGGIIPSVAKALKDAAAYKTPLPWDTGQVEGDLLQPRTKDGATYVPLGVPVFMDSTVNNTFWRLFTAAATTGINVFDDVATMKQAPLEAGILVRTEGFYAINPFGGASYYIATLGDFQAFFGTDPDGIVDHLMDNGKVAALIFDVGINMLQCGAIADGVFDNLPIVNAAVTKLSTGGEIIFPDLGGSIYNVSLKPNGTTKHNFNFMGSARFPDLELYPTGVVKLSSNDELQQTNFNTQGIQGDDVDQDALGGGVVNGFQIHHRIEGGGHTGTRNAFLSAARLMNSSAGTSSSRRYTGVQGVASAETSDNGTALDGVGSKGRIFGTSGNGASLNGATNLYNVTGLRGHLNTETGSSMWARDAVLAECGGLVQGTAHDSGVAVASQGVGFKTGVNFSKDRLGNAPVVPSGTLIQTQGTYDVDKGIDFSSVSFTGHIFSSKTFNITALGQLELGDPNVVGQSYIDFHSSGAGGDRDARILAKDGDANNDNGSLNYYASFHSFTGRVEPIDTELTDLGSPTNKWGTVYAKTIVADNVSGGTGSAFVLNSAQSGTLSSYDIWLGDSSTSAQSIAFPTSPTDGDEVKAKDTDGNAATNNLTMTRAGGISVAGDDADYVIDTAYAAPHFKYDAANTNWVKIN
ncbi:hypothetical protein N9937_00415 [bacterium]|nr:hypothetical protein [bacterium]